MAKLTHFDSAGASRMVDVGGKPETVRTAVRMQPGTLTLLLGGSLAKGDVREVARLAGIMAAKKTADLIPLCHPLPINAVSVDFEAKPPDLLEIRATVSVTGRTGVEMEALTAVSIAALTVYDMAKAADRSMSIERIQLDEKTGGRSGTYRRTSGRTRRA
jgi:cyclic pyranopterin phosphate synthase